MKDSPKLLFNIIYTRDTVKQLHIFVFSLLKHSSFTFRLVANGCREEECQLLTSLCDQHDRLEFWRLPTEEVLLHGEVLKALYEKDKDRDHFCFMDSDILFLPQAGDEIEQGLLSCQCLFSGIPIWQERAEYIMGQGYRNLLGRYYLGTNGECLGTTYFAVYETESLRSLFEYTNITFDGYVWENIPEKEQQLLVQRQLNFESYDTARVLNILLLIQGVKTEVKPMSTMHHLGGISYNMMERQELNLSLIEAGVLRFFGMNGWLFLKFLKGLRKIRSRPSIEKKHGARMVLSRIITVTYLQQVMLDLKAGRPVPKVPFFFGKRLSQRIVVVNTALKDLMRELSLKYLTS